MQRLEVSSAVRPIYGSLGVKRLIVHFGVVRRSKAFDTFENEHKDEHFPYSYPVKTGDNMNYV